MNHAQILRENELRALAAANVRVFTVKTKNISVETRLIASMGFGVTRD